MIESQNWTAYNRAAVEEKRRFVALLADLCKGVSQPEQTMGWPRLPLKAVETDFAVDSSGFATSRYVRWFNKKYGREIDDREWVKVHLMCGVNTRIVSAVEISGWAANDTTYFVPLVERTAANFEVREVSADKAYLSRKNLNAVESVGAIPFIPFKSNTLEPTEAGAWARMYHLFMYQRDAYMQHLH